MESLVIGSILKLFNIPLGKKNSSHVLSSKLCIAPSCMNDFFKLVSSSIKVISAHSLKSQIILQGLLGKTSYHTLLKYSILQRQPFSTLLVNVFGY